MDDIEGEASREPQTPGMRVARLIAIALVALLCGMATFQFAADAKIADLTVNRCAVFALAAAGLIAFLITCAVALVIFIFGVIGGLVARSGWFFLGATVVAGAVMVGFAAGHLLTNPVPCDDPAFVPAPRPSPTSNSTTQDAQIQIRFSEPFSEISLSGPASCSRRDRGGPVTFVGTRSANAASDWRWGVDKEIQVSVQLYLYPSAGHNRLQVLYTRSATGLAHYLDGYGGQTDIRVTGDGTSGQVTFTALGHAPAGNFDPAVWPDTISGSLSWSCSGPESSGL